MRVAVREHNSIMRRNLRQFNGYEVKTEGDAFIVSFKNVLDALRWCMTCQLQLLEADWPQEILESHDGQKVYGPKELDHPEEKDTLLYRGLSIRMGLHCGSPVCEPDPVTRRMDYFGPMVNKTARVCAQAEGGQILVSQDIIRAYRRLKMAGAKDEEDSSKQSKTSEKISNLNQLDPQFFDVGERKLKGFEKPELLTAIFPKAVVGRHIIPPPPLEKTQKPAVEINLPEPESRTEEQNKASQGDLEQDTNSLDKDEQLLQLSDAVDSVTNRVERLALFTIDKKLLQLCQTPLLRSTVHLVDEDLILSDEELGALTDDLVENALTTNAALMSKFVQRIELAVSSLSAAMNMDEQLASIHGNEDMLKMLRMLVNMAADN